METVYQAGNFYDQGKTSDSMDDITQSKNLLFEGENDKKNQMSIIPLILSSKHRCIQYEYSFP